MRKKVTRRISALCLVFCMLLAALFSDGSFSDILADMIGMNAVFADTGESSDDSTASDTDDTSEESGTASTDAGTDDIMDKVTVESNGESITAASFAVSESVTLTAEYSGGTSSDFCWQIYDSSQTTWLDISGQTTAEIRVSYALVANMLNDKSAAYVRCKVTDGELLYYSDVVTLCVDAEASGTTSTINITGTSGTTDVSSDSGDKNKTDAEIVVSAAETENKSGTADKDETNLTEEAGENDANTENGADEVTVCGNDLPQVTSSGSELMTYSITVKYLYYSGSTAYDSYKANVMSGGSLTTTVTSPTIVGYTPYINVEKYTTEQTGQTCIYSYTGEDDTVYYVYGTNASAVSLIYSDISSNQSVTVYYYPSTVNYTVLHYVQNILNDDYVLYRTETKTGYVGAATEITDLTNATIPDPDTELSNGGYICVSGSESSAIAADGSTVIYVYYDRVYFVMTFDLDGGSGVSPIYAKYGTPVSVSDPVKTGYTFAGWYDEYDSTKIIITLPTTIQPEEKRYVATWEAAETTYTVVYWRENANDTNYSYWYQTTIKAATGSDIDLDVVSDVEEANTVTTITGMTDAVYASDIDTSVRYFIGNAGKLMASSITKDGGTLTVPLTSYISVDYNSIPAFTLEEVSTGSGTYYISYESDGVIYYLCFTAFDSLKDAGGNTTASLSSTTDASEATVWYYDDYTSESSTKYGLYCKNTDTADTNTYYLCNGNGYLKVKKNGSQVYLYGVKETTAADSELAYFSYNESKTTSAFTTTTVAADGSTVVNIYYSRNEYTLRFFFARYYEDEWYIPQTTNAGWFFVVFDDETKNLNSIQTIDGILGYAKSITLEADSTDVTTYASMAGIDKSKVLLGTYYYVEITAKYNANISGYWPLAAGNITDSNTEDQNTVLDTQETANGGSYWKFVSWGTQYDSPYYSTYSNKNIKGPYGTMSEELITNKDSDGNYITSDNGSTQDLMAYYANSVYTYTYEIYMQNTNGNYVLVNTTYERSTANANGQNPYTYEGFTIINKETTIKLDDGDGEVSEVAISPDSEGRVYESGSYTIRFYYSRNQYTLSFYNISDYIEEEEQEVFYGAYLSDYEIDANTMENSYYPSTLVEDAYEFGGWYTTADCLDGTEVVFTRTTESTTDDRTTMPASDLVLYAKWIPKTYNVSVYQTSNMASYVYDYKNDGTGGQEIAALKWLVENNEGLNYGANLSDAVHSSGPETDIAENRNYEMGDVSGTGEIEEDWIFVCWAYQKDGVEYALDVSSFTVFGDVDIYAKWTSNTLLSYEITYVAADLYVDNNGNIYDCEGGHLLTFDSSGNLYYIDDETNEAVYPEITAKTTTETNENGNTVTTEVLVADATTGYLYEGANRTFTAKTGTGLYEAYRKGYYPLTSSHSVLMVDEDKDGVVSYTFYYIAKSPVTYTVKFVDTDGNSMFDVVENHGYSNEVIVSYTGKETTDAVITENYLYFSGYTVDAIQKTLVLSANEKENVITFVYTKSNNATYTVNYYYEVWFDNDDVGSYDLAVETTDENGDAVTKYYRLYVTESGTVEVNGTFDVSTDWEIAGYEYVYHDVYQYTYDANTNTLNAGTATTYPIKDESDNVTDEGKTIAVEEIYGTLANVFYDLKTYPYIVYHKYLSDGSNVIDPVQETAVYTSEVTAEALTDSELNERGIYGYTVDTSQKSTTITITIEVEQEQTPTVNVITFYYYEKDVTYQYKTMIKNSSGAVTELNNTSAVVLSLELEYVKVDTSTASGSMVYYDSALYEFLGWYLDEDCTILLTKDGKSDGTSTYTEYDYAKVEAATFELPGTSSSTEKLTPQKVLVSGSNSEDNCGISIYQTDTSLNTGVNTETIQVFYALLQLRTGNLTITRDKDNTDQNHYNAANSFVYTVTQLTDANGNKVTDPIVMTVTIDPGDDSVKIYDLPAGEYTVTQESSWSWRYTEDSTFTVDNGETEVTKVTIESGKEPTVAFDDPYSRYWLSGFSKALVNSNGN